MCIESVGNWMTAMIEPSTLTAISAIASLVAALGGMFAAIAAYRSAGAAKEAARHAQEVERKGLVRAVVVAAHSTVSETTHVYGLGHQVKQAYENLAVFSGPAGDSTLKPHIKEIERKQNNNIVPLQEEAMKLLGHRESLREATEDELADSLSQMEGYLAAIQRVKEEFERDLKLVEREIQIYKEKAIKEK